MGETGADLGTLKVTELELPHDLIPDYVGCCKEPTTAARLLVGDGPSLELDFGVENMGDCNRSFTRNQAGLEVVVSQDGATELNLGIGSCSGLPGINVRKEDGTVARLWL